MAFERWSSEITAAGDAESQRRLLGEIGRWRAANLTDIPGLREAAFAMSTLYTLVGQRDAAVREARSLLSLCQTTPVATKEERASAKAYLASLGEKAPDLKLPRDAGRGRGREREPRKRERGDRREREQGRESAVDIALQRAQKGDHVGALKILKGKKGRAELVRAWVRLDRALNAEDRDAQLASLDRWFRQVLGVADSAPAAQPAPVAPTAEDGPLAQLVGRKLPKRREARVRALNRWISEHPDQADALAATALRAHLAESGPDIPAPWLVAFVGRARLGESTQTDAALAELAEAGSRAVEVYGEWPFDRATTLARSVAQRFSGLRRGVLGRGVEPDDRRAWTLRLDDDTRMLALVTASDDAYPADAAAQVAARLPALCSRVVLLAPGAGNAPLREAVAAAGIVTLDGEPSDTELLSALDAVAPVAAPERPAKAAPKAERTASEKKPKAEKPKAEKKPAKPEGPDPIEALSAVLFGEAVPTAETLAEPVGKLAKLRDAFLAADTAWSPLPDDASARLGALLHAADAAAPDGLTVPEGTTLALRIGAAQGGPAADAITSGSTATRFGGPGASDVLGIVTAAASAGWTLRRAFRGTTRRERRGNPALTELSSSLSGVWRLGLDRDGARKEIWYVADLPIEGRAAIPQLLLEERDRVVVLPIDAELMAWWGGLGGPDALGWTPEDASALVESLG